MGLARAEFQELCAALLDRVKLHTDERAVMEDCPLFLHRQYQREEVLVALGLPQLVGTFPTQAGRFWNEALRTEVLFVTLDKSDKTFSPSTRYEDFALSPTRFHWQSQSTTSDDFPNWSAVRAPARERCEVSAFRAAEEERLVPIPRAFAICFPFGQPTDEHLLGSGVSDARLVLRGMRHAPGGLKP